jgi:hypothetical protein
MKNKWKRKGRRKGRRKRKEKEEENDFEVPLVLFHQDFGLVCCVDGFGGRLFWP